MNVLAANKGRVGEIAYGVCVCRHETYECMLAFVITFITRQNDDGHVFGISVHACGSHTIGTEYEYKILLHQWFNNPFKTYIGMKIEKTKF